MDLISVLVITYNSSKTVIETLDSIKNQTYKNLELIVCDDHSTDDTITVVKEWLRKNSKRFVNVRVLIGKRNHGVTKNCNIGISQIQGKYVQLIAGDDILLEEAIEKKYMFAKNNHISVVYSKVEPFGKNISYVKTIQRNYEKSYTIIKKGWKEQYDNIILNNFIPATGGDFYLSGYIKEIGYDTHYPMLEDYPLIYQYIVNGNEVVLLDEVLTRYRISDTAVGKSSSKYIRDCMKFFLFVRLKELMKNRRYLDAKEEFLGLISRWINSII